MTSSVTSMAGCIRRSIASATPNLKRELPRIPFAPDFWGFAKAGERLADLLLNYEKQPECSPQRIEQPERESELLRAKLHLSRRDEALK